MLEWTNVQPSKYELNNELVDVKTIHKFTPYTGAKILVQVDGRDIDHLAYKLLGTELESLNLMEINAVKLLEYKFRLSKIQTVMIPL